jgi:hypothetical protein
MTKIHHQLTGHVPSTTATHTQRALQRARQFPASTCPRKPHTIGPEAARQARAAQAHKHLFTKKNRISTIFGAGCNKVPPGVLVKPQGDGKGWLGGYRPYKVRALSCL